MVTHVLTAVYEREHYFLKYCWITRDVFIRNFFFALFRCHFEAHVLNKYDLKGLKPKKKEVGLYWMQ